jgi:hypothetical protein
LLKSRIGKVSILILERRHTAVDPRPEVFCAVASSVGESLDARRVSTPSDNTLQDIAEALVEWDTGNPIPSGIAQRVKITDSAEFGSSDRWDVLRFWDDSEQVAIGERDEAVETSAFVSEIKEELTELLTELSAVESSLQSLTQGPSLTLPLSDASYFRIRRGKRVTRKNCDDNPGPIPVYSGSKFKKRPLGRISEEFANRQGIKIENSTDTDQPIITINANGAVGHCFVRYDKCIIHDDVMIVEVLSDQLDLDYVEVALRKAIVAGNYEYEAKLYNRVKDLEIEVPATESNEPDFARQVSIAKTQKHLETVSQRIAEAGKYANEVRLR